MGSVLKLAGAVGDFMGAISRFGLFIAGYLFDMPTK
jgi:hypothetical protein